MHTRRTIFMLAGMALATGAASLAAQPVRETVQPVHQVAVEVSAYPLVFVMVRVNGQEVRALVDTGSATPVRLSARLAQQLNLTLTPDPTSSVQSLDGRRLSVQSAQLDTLSVGDWLQRHVSVEIAADRVEAVSAQVGTKFDAILGWSFLARRSFRLDYRQRTLQFSDSPLQLADKGVAMHYSVVNRLPVVAARLGDQNVTLLVDTGAPMCNIDADLAQLPIGRIVDKELTLDNTKFPVQWRVKDLTVTRKALGTIGTLGNNLLRRHVIYFNTRNQTMVLD